MLNHNWMDTRTRPVAASLQSFSFSNDTYADAYRLLRTTRTTSRRSKYGNLFASDRYWSTGAQQSQLILDPSLDDSTLAKAANTLSLESETAVERTAGIMGMRLTVASLEKRSPEKSIWRSWEKRSRLKTPFRSASGMRQYPAIVAKRKNAMNF